MSWAGHSFDKQKYFNYIKANFFPLYFWIEPPFTIGVLIIGYLTDFSSLKISKVFKLELKYEEISWFWRAQKSKRVLKKYIFAPVPKNKNGEAILANAFRLTIGTIVFNLRQAL